MKDAFRNPVISKFSAAQEAVAAAERAAIEYLMGNNCAHDLGFDHPQLIREIVAHRRTINNARRALEEAAKP